MLDCQTTGSSPARGRVLEIAWSRGSTADGRWGTSPEIVSHLVRLPEGERLPPRIAAMTGIRPLDLDGGVSRGEAWRRLRGELESLATASPEGRPTGVAHFARFERAFLDDWRREEGGEPFDLLCTHEIAIRLLPGLPRRGLRAVAGFLGHVMAEERRARGHVRATIAVWRALVRQLGELGVTTLADLSLWQREAKPKRRGGREFSLPREERLALPDVPGVYRMRGRGGEVLYVGKATSLRQRVNSYFRTRHRRPGGNRTLEMLTQVSGVEVTPCASPLEAALREADAIKEHAPPYNVALRGREVSVYFATPELGTLRTAPIGKHRIGPLPKRDSLAPIWALQRLLGGKAPPAGRSSLWMTALGLGVPRSWPERFLDRRRLDDRGLREGLALFFERTGWAERPFVPVPEMLRVGGELWLEHLAERREQEAEETASPPEEEEGSRDPEDVAKWYALALGRCAQLVQRAKWFVKLCESSLWWRPVGGEAQLVLLERGALASCRSAEEDPAEERAPVPRGVELTAHQRRRCFDTATYDRLRVLTTELRRLVTEGAEIELRLGSGRALNRASLARRMEGV